MTVLVAVAGAPPTIVDTGYPQELRGAAGRNSLVDMLIGRIVYLAGKSRITPVIFIGRSRVARAAVSLRRIAGAVFYRETYRAGRACAQTVPCVYEIDLDVRPAAAFAPA